MINWKLRLKNKVTLTAIIACLVGIVYQTLGMVGVVPSISENIMISYAGEIVNLLVLVGVVTDPTTAGLTDSEQAMMYDEPRSENK